MDGWRRQKSNVVIIATETRGNATQLVVTALDIECFIKRKKKKKKKLVSYICIGANMFTQLKHYENLNEFNMFTFQHFDSSKCVWSKNETAVELANKTITSIIIYFFFFVFFLFIYLFVF